MEFQFIIEPYGACHNMVLTDFNGETLRSIIDERKPLIHYKQKLKAKAIRKYLIGYVKRRIAAYSVATPWNTAKIAALIKLLNSLQLDMQYSYADFVCYIKSHEFLLRNTLPKKKEDRSTRIVLYILTNL